ncbi:MAG TPA: carboxymuconolactone decarboxylase family protein [Burkholderiales bacterium]|jgi:alkyl hydroperoxide reductase subunit D|nr:carboxymuconolactone decarboxylase family protein [Burkholderiales bacterium]
MSIQTLKDRLPEYAKDLKLNLGSLAAETVLNDTLKAGTFVAAAFASRNPVVIAAMNTEFSAKLAPADFTAAKAAAAIMGMNNVYYRFLHLSDNAEYQRLPAKLRMNVIAAPGTAKENFELWSLAVSAINGCGLCIAAHDKVVRAAGITAEQVQAAVRIAAVVHAIAVTLEAEAASNRELAEAA